jgi:serine/threonine protein kinase
MIAFSCPHCGVQLQVKENLAGIARPCPNCSRVVRAPGGTASSRPGLQTNQRVVRENTGRSSGHPTLGTSSATEDTAPPVVERSDTRPYPFLAPPQGVDELGRLGTYVVRKVLGVGAMGVVFQAEDPQLKRPVALKVMKPSLAAFAEYHRRFLREAQLAAAIEHDHIVTIYQVGEDGGVPYLAMKLLQGETLEDRLSQIPGGLALSEVLRIGREVAEGLEAAHERSLVHRDIKPANIWLEAGRDRVKIVDFGLACGTGEDGRFTQAGAVIGTPAYMSPEQANAEDVDARCDLFSLGAVLYRACTGEMPFGGKDTLSVLSALASRMPPAPHTIIPSLPRAFSDLVMRLLQKDRTKRPQAAREVVKAIDDIERNLAKAAAAPPPRPKEDIPVAKVLPSAPQAPRTAVVQDVPVARVLEREAVTTAPAASANGVRQKGSDSDVQRKGANRNRSSNRKKKASKSEPDLARIVLFTSLALLGVALMVLVLGILTRTNVASPAPVAPGNAPTQLNDAQVKQLEEFRRNPIQFRQPAKQEPAAQPDKEKDANTVVTPLQRRPGQD